LFVFRGCLQLSGSRDFLWNGGLGRKGFRRFQRFGFFIFYGAVTVIRALFSGVALGDFPGAVSGFS